MLLAVVAVTALFGVRDALASPPTAPQNVSSTVSANQATVSWQPPASDGGKAISAYKIIAFVGGTTPQNATFVGPSAGSVSMTGLSGGTSFSVTWKHS